MFKKFLVALAALIAATAFAAADANKATQAELEAIKGIGPVISTLIIGERKKGDFKNWEDLVVRVKGVGEKSAAKFSEGGLTVNGSAYPGAPAKAAGPAKAEPPMTTKVASAVKGGAEKVETATKATASKAASAVKGAASTVATNAKEEKDAMKANVKDAKEKRAEKKAEKAEKKAEAAAAASAPMKK